MSSRPVWSLIECETISKLFLELVASAIYFRAVNRRVNRKSSNRDHQRTATQHHGKALDGPSYQYCIGPKHSFVQGRYRGIRLSGRPAAPESSNPFFQNISRHRRSGSSLLGKSQLAINLGKSNPSGRLAYIVTVFRIPTYSVTSD
jgi:hypothetical protein